MRYPVGMYCPKHGFQEGRTSCKWCGYDTLSLKANRRGAGGEIPKIGFDRRAFSSLSADGLGARQPPPPLSFKLPDDKREEFINWMP